MLGPILLLFFVNHVVSTLGCSYKMFVDGIKLYRSCSNALDSLENSVQNELNTLVRVMGVTFECIKVCLH